MPIDDTTDRPTFTAAPSSPPVARDAAANDPGNPGNHITRTQRALLEDLLALHDMQAEALDRGDLGSLARLSERRGALVSEAAPYLPPHAPWAPELNALATRARERADELQQAVRACMAIVRRDLITPAGHRRTAHSPQEQQPD